MKIIKHSNRWGNFTQIIFITDDGCGCVTMDILDENPTVALICNMSVIKEKRGQGYGNKLLKACEKDAMKRTKVTSVELWTDSGSIAYEWYKRQGYVLTEEWQVITRKVFLVKLKKELEK